MARYEEPTPAQEAEWKAWVKSRPPVVRDIAEKLDPWTLYKIDTGHRVTLRSINENGTVTVLVLGKYNLVDFERQVFGVPPDELVPCDLPGPDEEVGAAMTQAEVTANLDELRLQLRPDLWKEGPGGKAVARNCAEAHDHAHKCLMAPTKRSS